MGSASQREESINAGRLKSHFTLKLGKNERENHELVLVSARSEPDSGAMC